MPIRAGLIAPSPAPSPALPFALALLLSALSLTVQPALAQQQPPSAYPVTGYGQTGPAPGLVMDLVLVDIPGASFVMGDPQGEPDEAPRWVQVDRLLMMRNEVTVRQFAAFVQDTAYVTDAERSGYGLVWRNGWTTQPAATWREPFGPGSSVAGFPDHPVTQVSQRDAANFCYWARLRLPREPEWEYAARGAQDQRRYPWGDTPPEPRLGNFGAPRCCTPSGIDGYLGTAPVGSYPLGTSPFGLLDMAGNVWEWTATPYPGAIGHVVIRGGGWANDGYQQRVSYRRGAASNVSMDMVGFRCAGDPPGAVTPAPSPSFR